MCYNGDLKKQDVNTLIQQNQIEHSEFSLYKFKDE